MVDYISVEEAAKELGMSKEAFRECMRQDSFPIQIGMAWHYDYARKWNFKVSKKLFNELLEILGEKQ